MSASMTPEEQRSEIARLDFDANTKEVAARLEFQVRLATEVFKALMLVNGGALIALFTLIGNLDKHSKTALAIRPGLLWWGFSAFSAGLVFTVAAGLCAFLSQRYFYEATQYIAWNDQQAIVAMPAKYDPLPVNTVANLWLGAGILLTVSALAAFLLGAGLALASVIPA